MLKEVLKIKGIQKISKSKQIAMTGGKEPECTEDYHCPHGACRFNRCENSCPS